MNAGKFILCTMVAINGQPKQMAIFSDMSKSSEHLVCCPRTNIVLCQQRIRSYLTFLQVALILIDSHSEIQNTVKSY